MGTARLPVAVLISGGGTTLRNLLEKIDAGQLDIDVRLVISSSTVAKGLDFATRANIPTRVIRPRDFSDTPAFSEEIFAACRSKQVELVVLGGFLKQLTVPDDYVNRVTNIHPALIPSFCGKGYYGTHVHQAALDYGVKVSGCTVHFVDNEYDHGPIIYQAVVEVRPDDDAHQLAARVFEAECEAYPKVLQWYAEGRIKVEGRRVRIEQHA
jgi:phosphoribosylglycinamide formyltransferase-1